MIGLETVAAGVIIAVRAQPGAKRNAILGEHDGALRVAVTAAPDKGKANQAVTAAPDKGKANQAIAAVLADAFGIAKSAVELVSGQTSRQKKFLMRGLSIAAAETIISKFTKDLE